MTEVSREDIERVRGSRLFDAEWYLEQYPDVGKLGMDPVAHYLWLGARLKRNPSAQFDGAAYLEMYADVAAACVNPLLHYIRWGKREGRSARPRQFTRSASSETGAQQIIDPIHVTCASVKRGYSKFDTLRDRVFLAKIEELYSANNNSYDDTLVSIVMPTFNRRSVISKAIESVLSQSHKNWELLVVDDGSMDNTSEVVNQFLCDSRIHYAPLEHSGVSAARNHGLKSATGSIIAYLDSDNLWEPHFLRAMIVFVLSQRLDAAYSSIEVIDDEDFPKLYRGDIFVWSACLRTNYIDLNCFVHMRHLALSTEKRELFDTKLKRLVDWDFILRLTAQASVSYAPFVGVRYYDGGKLNRITLSEYTNGELPVIMQSIRNKHAHRGSKFDNIDTAAGHMLSHDDRALFDDRAFLNAEVRYKLIFFPDYRVNNPYQALVYSDFKDYEIGPGSIDDCLKWITENRELQGKIIFHLHWLSPIVSPAGNPTEAKLFVDTFLAKARLFNALGGRILWTVHNIMSHEPKYPDDEIRLSKGIVELAEWIHVHHAEVAEATKPLYELVPEKVLPAEHGNYIGVLPVSMSREQARKELRIPSNATVFLFLGQIRGYKGIDDLIKAFAQLCAEQDCWLVVAGKVLGVNQTELHNELAKLPNCVFRPGYVPDEQMQLYLKSADAMVLPYKSVLTSGSIFLAMSYGLPVICPHVGLLKHIVKDGENGLVYDDDEGLLSAMRRFLMVGRKGAGRMGSLALRTAEAYRWEETSGKLRRHIEGMSFGLPIRTSLPQSSRVWFVRGELESLKGKRCIALVLHYRNVEDSKKCIDNVLAQGDDLGLILISNNESLEDARALARLYPNIVTVQSEGNIGYAAANNFGLWACRRIRPEFFWILNPDVIVPRGFYSEIVERAGNRREHDFFASTLVSMHQPDKVIFCGGEVQFDQGARPGHLYMGRKLSDLPDAPFECDYLTGANIFGRTRALQKIGYLPEEYFLYFEETEWFVNYVRNGGARPMVFPDLVAYNYKKSEFNGVPQRYYLYYFCRNSLLFGQRFAGGQMKRCEDEARKFADAWLAKIASRAPERLVEFRELVEQSLADGRNGRTGKSAFPEERAR